MGNWKIDGRPEGTEPKVFGVYKIEHSRKGIFFGRIIEVNDNFATVELLEGNPHFASRETKFDSETDLLGIRDSLSYLTEIVEREG